jgi:hypothetical protein
LSESPTTAFIIYLAKFVWRDALFDSYIVKDHTITFESDDSCELQRLSLNLTSTPGSKNYSFYRISLGLIGSGETSFSKLVLRNSTVTSGQGLDLYADSLVIDSHALRSSFQGTFKVRRSCQHDVTVPLTSVETISFIGTGSKTLFVRTEDYYSSMIFESSYVVKMMNDNSSLTFENLENVFFSLSTNYCHSALVEIIFPHDTTEVPHIQWNLNGSEYELVCE